MCKPLHCLDVVFYHSYLDGPDCGMGYCSAGQTNFQIWERLSEQKEASFFQDNLVFGLLHAEAPLSSRFKVQGFFICHMINYTGYNQK